jgi:hypothetical protein
MPPSKAGFLTVMAIVPRLDQVRAAGRCTGKPTLRQESINGTSSSANVCRLRIRNDLPASPSRVSPKGSALISSFSLRGLCDLGVSVVNNGFKYNHRGNAENAEVAQRISN